MQVSEPTGGVAAGQENPGDRTRPARPPPPLLLNLRSAGPACNRRRVPGGMGYDGRIGMRLSPWPRALQLPRGRGARGAAPERARGLPSVKAPACIASTPGASTLFLPAVSRQVPSTPASRPRPAATSWSPANSFTLLEASAVRAGTGRRAPSCGGGVARRPTRRPLSGSQWKQRRHSGCRRRQRCDPQRPVDGKADHAPLQRHVRQAAGDNSREIAEPPLSPAPSLDRLGFSTICGSLVGTL